MPKEVSRRGLTYVKETFEGQMGFYALVLLGL